MEDGRDEALATVAKRVWGGHTRRQSVQAGPLHLRPKLRLIRLQPGHFITCHAIAACLSHRFQNLVSKQNDETQVCFDRLSNAIKVTVDCSEVRASNMSSNEQVHDVRCADLHIC
jgi:hypothetical protein